MISRPTFLQARPDEGFRDAQARIAIGVVRPLLLLIGIFSGIANTIADPGSVTGEQWLRLGVFCGLQVLFWLLLATRLRTDVVALTAFSLDGIMLAATMYLEAGEARGAITFVILIVMVGYFARPLATVAFSVASAATVAVIGPTLDGWDDPGPIPTVSVALLITGVAMAYLSSRMRDNEARLAQLVRSQDDALERLRVVDRLRHQLIANVSHELRTPLTATIGSIETLLRRDIELDPAQREKLLNVARDGGLRLLLVVEDLLTLGATRPDSLELTTEPERLSSIARDATVGIEPDDGRTITITTEADPLVRVDRLRMLQVVSNLLVNALRHGRGDVVIDIDRTNGHAKLRVLDDGVGIDPAHEDELFLPFTKFSTRTDSTGLGLAICRTIVEAHGGTIAYARTADARTCFGVTLPVAEASEPVTPR